MAFPGYDGLDNTLTEYEDVVENGTTAAIAASDTVITDAVAAALTAQEATKTASLSYDAWGRPKTVQDFSIIHGVFSNGIQLDKWKVQEDGTEILGPEDPSNFTATLTVAPVRSENGMLKCESVVAGTRITFRSLRHPRYQPNRGHLFSDANMIEGATGGTLYAVVRTMVNNVVTDTEVDITDQLGGIDLSKGNVWDIQMQWRGVGDFTFASNLQRLYNTGVLGSRTDLSTSNPALSVMYEAYKGTDNVTDPSYVTWGVGTEENGVFYKYSYDTVVDAKIKVGCADVTSEGGGNEHLSYGSVATGVISTASSGAEKAICALRVPASRSTYNTGGTEYTTYNTRDLVLSALSTGQSDEHTVRMYISRDSSSVTSTGWVRNWSDDVDYTDYGIDSAMTFNSALMDMVFSTQVELDQPWTKTNPVGGRGDFYLTNGTYILVTMQPKSSGSDDVSVTLEFGSEK